MKKKEAEEIEVLDEIKYTFDKILLLFPNNADVLRVILSKDLEYSKLKVEEILNNFYKKEAM